MTNLPGMLLDNAIGNIVQEYLLYDATLVKGPWDIVGMENNKHNDLALFHHHPLLSLPLLFLSVICFSEIILQCIEILPLIS